MTIPYIEDFDSSSTCGTGCTTSCTLPTGWTQSGTRDWLIDAGGTTSSQTGPSVDHTTGTATGNYIYMETSGCTGTWEAVSPLLETAGTTAPIARI
ncbi:MAG: hypothetical protein AAGA56_10070, partial [Myxococcota bacterium]